MDALLASLSTTIATFAASHAWVAGVLMAVGILRATMKPLFSLIHTVAKSAGLLALDAEVTTVESSKAYTYFCYFLDYAFSIKVGTQTPAAQAAKIVQASDPAVVAAIAEKPAA